MFYAEKCLKHLKNRLVARVWPECSEQREECYMKLERETIQGLGSHSEFRFHPMYSGRLLGALSREVMRTDLLLRNFA